MPLDEENTQDENPQEFNLTRIIEFIEAHISLILLVPGIIGSIMQIKSLSKIGIGYIRFFSVSQIIPDGTLVLTIIVGFASIAFIYGQFLGLRKDSLKESTKKYINNYHQSLLRFSLQNSFKTIVLCLLIVIFLPITISSDLGQSSFLMQLSLYSACFALVYHQFLWNILIEANMGEKNPHYKNKKTFYLPQRFNIILTLLTIVFIFFKSFSLIQDNPSENLENYQKLKSNLKTEYKDLENYKILYFNDNYTFVEIKQKGKPKSSTVIYKTEKALFE